MSEFDKVDVCVNCKIKDFCEQFPDDEYTCEEVMEMSKQRREAQNGHEEIQS